MNYSEIIQTIMSFALILFGAMAIYARVKLRWVETKLERLEASAELRGPAALDPADAERLDLLESGIDRLEARMEQLAEGQEFLGRVLTDRVVDANRPAPRSNETTPH